MDEWISGQACLIEDRVDGYVDVNVCVVIQYVFAYKKSRESKRRRNVYMSV